MTTSTQTNNTDLLLLSVAETSLNGWTSNHGYYSHHGYYSTTRTTISHVSVKLKLNNCVLSFIATL